MPDLLRKMPKLIAVQAANCSPVYAKFKGITDPAEASDTLAEGIAISGPVRINDIISAVEKTEGDIFTVDEKEIKEKLLELLGRGFYTEPTSAAVIAGAEKYMKDAADKGADPGKTVTVLTGSGLKAAKKIYKIMKGGV